MGNKFVIKKAKDGLTFSFVSASGDILASSEVYTTKVSTKAGIASVQKNAGASIEDQTQEDYEAVKTPKWQIFKDKAGGFRFRLIATNGKNVVHTSAFKTFEDAKKALSSLKRTAAAAPIEDQSLVRQPKNEEPKKAPAKKAAAKK